MSDKSSYSTNFKVSNPRAFSTHKHKVKIDAAKTLNSYLYEKPNVVERLTQGERRTVEEYRDRAAGHTAAFERAFAGRR